MGCGGSSTFTDDYGNDPDDDLPLNDQKTEWDDLPSLTQINGERIETYFTIEKVLGSGGSCKVVKAKRKSDKNLYAMKELVRDDQWNPMLFKKEIQVLSELSGHVNILSYCESYLNEKYFYLNTQLCTGGELFDKVKKLKHFSEKVAAETMIKIIKAMQYCHKNKIVHRDLKPENIVYQSRKSDSDIVIIDFGDAEKVTDDQQIYSDFVGTPFYLAPECVRHRCGWELYKSDMWALGVITYVLLTGRPPFWGRNNREILTKIIKAQIHWPSTIRLSSSCKLFITALLNKDPRKRLSAKEALQHPWLVTESQKYNSHLGDDMLRALKKFQTASKLKKLIVTSMVAEMSDHDKKIIARAFHELDINGDGFVDHSELTKYLLSTGNMSLNAAKARATELIQGMDADGDGKIDLQEWLHGKTADKLTNDAKLIELQFEKILSSTNSVTSTVSLKGPTSDDDDVGSGGSAGSGPKPALRRDITTEELHKSFADLVDQDELEEIIDEIDENGDGVVDFNEFQNAMRQYTFRD